MEEIRHLTDGDSFKVTEDDGSEAATFGPSRVLSAVPTFGTPGIRTRQHAWSTWTRIAVTNEAEARRAEQAGDIMAFEPGLVSITSAAFALDALHGVLLPFVRVTRAAGGHREESRPAHVSEVLRQAVEVPRRTEAWRDEIRWLYEIRRDVVHFEERDERPVWHSGFDSNVAPEVLRWGPSEATRAVDLVLDVLGTLAHHPHARTADWSGRYAPSIDQLIASRS